MKSVLVSVQPMWCEPIAYLNKSVEIRKTRPKIDTPFKCYIYQTTKSYINKLLDTDGRLWEVLHFGRGKVIGEFICDEIYPIKVFSNCAIQNWNWYKLSRSCLSIDDVAEYIGVNKTGYGWHISNLVIYDEPKELSEFRYFNPTVKFENGYPMPTHKMTRPPQSWCYVQELG